MYYMHDMLGRSCRTLSPCKFDKAAQCTCELPPLGDVDQKWVGISTFASSGKTVD